MSDVSSSPKCPHCGFTVFTNRYPKCEGCGQQLPSSMVLSKQEFEALMEKERIQAFEAKQAAQRKAALKPDGAEPNIHSGISIDFGGSGSGVGGGELMAAEGRRVQKRCPTFPSSGLPTAAAEVRR